MTPKPEKQCTGCGATVTGFHDKRDDSHEWRDVTGSPYCPEGDVHSVDPTLATKCSFSIGDTVRWMGQDGPKVGTVRKITHPENAGFVLWIGDGEMEDFPLVESQASVELPSVDYPPIPDYIREPIVFRNANLGVAMVGIWNDQQWIFAVHPAGKWITIRRSNSSDPLFIDPINKAACPGCESENAPHLTSCRVPRKPSKFDPSCETTKAMPVSLSLPPVAIKPEAAPQEFKHTPGPWKIARASKPDNTGGYDYALVDGKGKLIAEFFEHVGQLEGGFDKRPAQANAEFAAHACNSHDEMLAALKVIVGANPHSHDEVCEAYCKILFAERVIAKAEAVQA